MRHVENVQETNAGQGQPIAGVLENEGRHRWQDSTSEWWPSYPYGRTEKINAGIN
jgi:hypothetical protein